MGTPTSYDCTFGPVINEMMSKTGIMLDKEMLGSYFRFASNALERTEVDLRVSEAAFAKEMKISNEDLNKIINPFEAMYTIADQTRTLLFAISDGSLPSNVGGGYNLRVILRRALAILEKRIGWNFDLGLKSLTCTSDI